MRETFIQKKSVIVIGLASFIVIFAVAVGTGLIVASAVRFFTFRVSYPATMAVIAVALVLWVARVLVKLASDNPGLND